MRLCIATIALLGALPLFGQTSTGEQLKAGAQLVEQKDYAGAEKVFRQVLAQIPLDLRATNGIVEVLLATGRIDQALEFARAQSGKDPSNLQLRNTLAIVLLQSNKVTEAIAELESLVKVTSDVNLRGALYMQIGGAQRRAKRLDLAIAAFEQAKLLLQDPLVALQLALLLEEAGQGERAMQEYTAALALGLNDPIALNNLAYAMADRGQNLEAALNFAERAKEALPNNPNIMDTVGFVHLKRGKPAEAMAEFREAYLRQGSDIELRRHMVAALDLKETPSPEDAQLRSLLVGAYTAANDKSIRELLGK